MDVLLALISALAFSLGNIFQKIGLSRLKGESLVWRETLVSGYWWLGMLTTALAVIISYWITAHASLSIVQPIICLNPILSVVFAKYFFGDKFGFNRLISLGLLTLGLIIFATLPPETSTVQHAYAGFCFAVFAMILVFLAWANLRPDFRWSILAGFGFGLSPILFKGLFAEMGTIDFESGMGWVDGLFHVPSLMPFVLVYVFAFLASQIALYNGRVSVVVPISAGLGALISALAGVVVFAESIAWPKLLALVLLGISILFYKDE